ncbi:MAG: hypothetical protein ACR2M3_01510 [Thermomicrobiales bacterium]
MTATTDSTTQSAPVYAERPAEVNVNTSAKPVQHWAAIARAALGRKDADGNLRHSVRSWIEQRVRQIRN